MIVKSVLRLPFGTVVSLDQNVPENVTTQMIKLSNGSTYPVKGTPSNIWTEVLLPSNAVIGEGEVVTFV